MSLTLILTPTPTVTPTPTLTRRYTFLLPLSVMGLVFYGGFYPLFLIHVLRRTPREWATNLSYRARYSFLVEQYCPAYW